MTRVGTIWVAVILAGACAGMAVLSAFGPTLPHWLFARLPGIAVIVAALTALALRARGAEPPLDPPGALALLAVVGLAFGAAQQALGNAEPGHPWIWFGLLPAADSLDYLQEATQLLHAGQFDSLRGRPLHTGTVAMLLRAADFDLSTYAWLTTALAALSCWVAALALWRSHGLGAALFLAAVLFSFYHYFTGSFMTETFGFVYGNLAFAVLWEGARRDSAGWMVTGLAFATLAQCVRVGPLLMLPALALAIALPLRRGWPTGRILLGSAALVVVVLAANGALTRAVTPASGGSFANASDSIYRLLVQGQARLGRYDPARLRGSAPWLQIYDDYPQIRDLPQPERVAAKQQILFETLAAAPHAALFGAPQEWNEYLFDFQFLPFPSVYDNDPATLIVAVLFAVGLVACLVRWRQRHALMAAAASLGIFCSVPFLIGGQTRVYAATMVFTAALAALGWHALAWRLRGPRTDPISGRSISTEDAAGRGATSLTRVASAALIGMLGLAAGGIWVGGPDHATANPDCAGDEQARVLLLRGGSALRFTEAADGHAHGISRARLARSAAGNDKWAPDRLSVRVLSAVREHGLPIAVYTAFDARTLAPGYLLRPETARLSGARATPLCTRYTGGLTVARIPAP